MSSTARERPTRNPGMHRVCMASRLPSWPRPRGAPLLTTIGLPAPRFLEYKTARRRAIEPTKECQNSYSYLERQVLKVVPWSTTYSHPRKTARRLLTPSGHSHVIRRANTRSVCASRASKSSRVGHQVSARGTRLKWLHTGDTSDLASVAAALDGVYGAWINIDGFTVGEQREIYAGLRIFELAKQTKSLRHYIWSSLDYNLKVNSGAPWCFMLEC
jgi:hypothetical protein